jgi:RNA polymerase sigma-70 factor (ECF subfamily)
VIEDRWLILRFKRGSTDALRRIYEKYERAMLAVAFGLLNDHSAAEDVVHDVFVAFAQSAERLSPAGSLRSYLTTCTANLARDRCRAARRQSRCLDRAPAVGEDTPSPLGEVLRDEQWRQLSDALSQLPYEQREAVVLHLKGGMTFQAMARAQGLSINTVQSRYRYGIEKLRSLLNGEVGP